MNSPHKADDNAGAGKRWRLAAFLLLGPCRCERTGIAQEMRNSSM